MAKNVVCGKCMIAWGLRESAKQYRQYIDTMLTKLSPDLSDYDKGFNAGIIVFAGEAIDDFESLIPYLQNEANLRTRSDKGS